MNEANPVVIAVGGTSSPEFIPDQTGHAPLERICGLFGLDIAPHCVASPGELRRTVESLGATCRSSCTSASVATT